MEPPGKHNYGEHLNNAICQMDSIAISSAHEAVDKIDYVFGQRENLNAFQNI